MSPRSWDLILLFSSPVTSMRREVTLTPNQAPVLLNDPQFVEPSRVLAAALVSKYGSEWVSGRPHSSGCCGKRNLHERAHEDTGDPEVEARIAQYEMAFRMQASVPEVSDLSDETESTFNAYGRDHHPRCFTIWMAGSGVKPGITYGQTDDFGYNIVQGGVHVHDFNATILHLMGIDHERLTYKYQGRRFRMTDVRGNVVRDILT